MEFKAEKQCMCGAINQNEIEIQTTVMTVYVLVIQWNQTFSENQLKMPEITAARINRQEE
jgi:hypothetical protein